MESYTFKNLLSVEGVVHGCFPRSMEGRTLNVAFEFGDQATRTRSDLALHLGVDFLVSAQQTHSDHMVFFDERPLITDHEIPDTDALAARCRGVGLMVKTADCQPILMAGKNGAGALIVAAIHSGWKGSLKNIAGKTVRAMVEKNGMDPATLVVGVGPSLGPCCATFSHPETELTPEALAYRVGTSSRFDFWAMTRDQLVTEGVPKEAIEFSNLCTVCDRDRWFSYRGDHPDSGRFGSIIGLL